MQSLTLRGLTVSQPWAALIAAGHKRYEIRSWTTTYRGWLAIHAGSGNVGRERFHNAFGGLSQGAVVGLAYLLDVQPIVIEAGWPVLGGKRVSLLDLCMGEFVPGAYAWKLGLPVSVEPVLRAGAWGLWNAQDVQAVLEERGIAPWKLISPPTPGG